VQLIDTWPQLHHSLHQRNTSIAASILAVETFEAQHLKIFCIFCIFKKKIIEMCTWT